MPFNRTLWASQFAANGLIQTEYDQILNMCAVDYSNLISGSEEKITVPKYIANDAVEGDLDDGDFTEGDKSSFDIPLNEDNGGKEFSIGFLQDIFNQRSTNANYYSEHTKSRVLTFKKAYATALLVHIVNGTIDANRVKFADDTANELKYEDFVAQNIIFNKLFIEKSNRFAVIPPEKEGQLYKIAEFISADKMGKVVIPDGAIGKILNFWIIVANTPKVDTTGKINATVGNNTQISCLFGHKYGNGFGIDSYIKLTEEPDAKTGKTKQGARKRGGFGTAFNTYTSVLYENTIA